MNWLFVTTRFPWPIIDGHWLRVYHLARTLRAQGDDVSVLSFGGNGDGVIAYSEVGVRALPGPAGVHSSRGRARCLLGPYAYDPRLARAVAKHARGFDAVVLSGARMLQYSREASGDGQVVADYGDDPVLEYGRRGGRPQGLRERVGRLARRVGRPRYERKFLGNVGVTAFVSDADCESFSRRHPHARVECVPNGVDVDYFRRPVAYDAEDNSPPKIVFTGHMSNPNNQRAAVFLVREVAPLIWQRRADVTVQVVGAEPTEAVRSLAGPRVEVTGRVADIRPYLWGAAAVVLPMQSGTGIKNKLLEAWAAGAAVIATPLACQGVPPKEGENLLLALAREELAATALELVGKEELRRRLAAAGRRTVEEQFTWDTAADRLRRACFR